MENIQNFIDTLSEDKMERINAVSEKMNKGINFYYCMARDEINKIREEMNNKIPEEEMLFGEESKKMYEFARREAILMTKFNKGNVKSLEDGLKDIEILKNIASQMQDPDMKKIMFEIIKLYEEAILYELEKQKQIETNEINSENTKNTKNTFKKNDIDDFIKGFKPDPKKDENEIDNKHKTNSHDDFGIG